MERVKCVVYVINDGRKYKLRMSTPPEDLTIAKVKQTLQKPTGWPPEDQIITHNGNTLSDLCTIGSLQLQPSEALQLIHNEHEQTDLPPPPNIVTAVHPPPIPVQGPPLLAAHTHVPAVNFEYIVPPPHLDAFQAFFVRDESGKMFRVPAQGDVQLITMDQIKGYVAAVSGIPLHRQQLFFNGAQVLGYQTSAQVGIRPGDTLQLTTQPESPQTILDSRQLELANLLEQERLQREIERLEELRASIGQRHTIASLSTQSVRLSTPAVIQGTIGNTQQFYSVEHSQAPIIDFPQPPRSTSPTMQDPIPETILRPQGPFRKSPVLAVPPTPVPVNLPSMIEEQELIRREEEIKALARVEELERLRRLREREVQELQKAKDLEVELARMELEREQRRNQELDRINAEKRAQLREQQRLDEERRRVEVERERLKTERLKMDKLLFNQEMDYTRRELELEEERKHLLQRQHELLRDAAVAETGTNPRASPLPVSEGAPRSALLHLAGGSAHSTPPDSPHYHRSVSRQSLFPAAESPGRQQQLQQQYWVDPEAELAHLAEGRYTPAYRGSPYVH